MSDQRRRRWADIVQMLHNFFVFTDIQAYIGTRILHDKLIFQFDKLNYCIEG